MQVVQLRHPPFWPRRPPMHPARGVTGTLASGAKHWGHLVGTRRTCALSIPSRRCLSPKSGLGDLQWRCSAALLSRRRWWTWCRERPSRLAPSSPLQLSPLFLHLLHLQVWHLLCQPHCQLLCQLPHQQLLPSRNLYTYHHCRTCRKPRRRIWAMFLRPPLLGGTQVAATGCHPCMQLSKMFVSRWVLVGIPGSRWRKRWSKCWRTGRTGLPQLQMGCRVYMQWWMRPAAHPPPCFQCQPWAGMSSTPRSRGSLRLGTSTRCQ